MSRTGSNQMRGAIAVLICLLALAGCGSTTTVVTQTVVEQPASTASTATSPGSQPAGDHTIPALKGKRLDVAEEFAKEAHVPYKLIGGGIFGVIVASDWTVCEQEPPAGALAPSVKLVIARSC
jgi:hypothetical protein